MRIGEPVFTGGVVVVAAGTTAGAALSHPASLAPTLAFVGVILVALITAYFTKRRQDDALEAEETRHAQTLMAERERLELQLSHEREMVDLDEMRKVLDEASVIANNATAALQTYGMRAIGASKTELEVLENEAYATVKPVVSMYQRLVLRLGEEDPVAKTYLALQAALHAMNIDRVVADFPPFSRERKLVIPHVIEATREAHFAWMRASRDLVGLRRARLGKITPDTTPPAPGWLNTFLDPLLQDAPPTTKSNREPSSGRGQEE